MSSNVHGIILVDKPAGWTSHDVVARARRLTGQRKIGHTGTLDPMATGLLVLCLGDATRLVEYMTAHDKRYEAEVRLGVTTDTDDAEGTALETRPVPPLTTERLRVLEKEFSGTIMQRPPAFSAIKVGGQRAYAAARKGAVVEIAPRPVVVHEIRLEQTETPDLLRMDVVCGAGTYIRSLARDMGKRLSCGAHLASLRRSRVGEFSIDEASTLEDIERMAAGGALEGVLRMADEGVIQAPVAIVEVSHGQLLVHGGRLQSAAARAPVVPPVRLYDTAGSFLGIGGIDGGGELQPVKVLSSVQTR